MEPLAPQQLSIFLAQIGVLLALALMLGRAASRVGLPAVTGELCAGILVGSSILGLISPDIHHWLVPDRREQFHLLDAFAQVCVILFVGLAGTQMDLALARRRKVVALKVSLGGLMVPFALGWGVGYLLPDRLVADSTDRLVFALFLGVAMSVSALPVIVKTLTDMRLLHRNIGQLTVIAGMIDDVVGWLLLSIVSVMATTGLDGYGAARPVIYLVLFLLGALTVGRLAIGRLLRLTVRSTEPGLLEAGVVVILLAGASVTLALHLEAVLGAFVFGMLIRSTGVVDARRLAPLNTIVMSVLAPVFFATAGLRVDLTYLGDPVVLGAAAVIFIVAVTGKFVGAAIGAFLSRLDRWEALALGAGMNSRGVVQIVVAMVGLRLGVLNSETYTIIVLIAITTSLMAPPIIRYSAARIDHTAEERLRDEGLSDQIDQR
ncbi:cation:proton antiporter [Actinomadura nitritigenes]|uniref:cation:proton antiporter n=1 Tax=Actinomadura nitritigenes TaxID=134602 RepID=UPI003D8E40D4